MMWIPIIMFNPGLIPMLLEKAKRYGTCNVIIM